MNIISYHKCYFVYIISHVVMGGSRLLIDYIIVKYLLKVETKPYLDNFTFHLHLGVPKPIGTDEFMTEL